MRTTIGMVLLAGCNGGIANPFAPNSDSGKTIVYALDEDPRARIDRDVCGAGVGLNVPLGITGSLSYTVAPDGRDALVGTCTIDDTGTITECLTLVPEIVLTIDEDGALVAEADVPISLPESDCTGATLESSWRIELDGDQMQTQVVSEWRLDSSPECEDFEAQVINASNNGLGIEGCMLTHEMEGTLVAKCTSFNGLNCREP